MRETVLFNAKVRTDASGQKRACGTTPEELTDMVLRVLGLHRVRDTIIGDEEKRGISAAVSPLALG